jgi:Mrp family chromosome partitioning ATPase
MSKIYEALENAQRERTETGIFTGPQPPDTLQPLSLPKVSDSFMEEGVRLYQNLHRMLPELQKKALQFIGSHDGEGTSTIVRILAIVSAVKFGQSVLLLETDRHHPSQQLFFNLTPRLGWQEGAQGDGPIDQALYRVEETSLFISPMSQHPDSSPEIYHSERFERFWSQLRDRFDLVLVDSPPAAKSPDGLAICNKVDGVIFVLEAEKTRWPVAEKVKEEIIEHGGNLLGVILNKRRYYIPQFIYKRL